MSRTIIKIPCEMSLQEFNSILCNYMASEGFAQKAVKGEDLWQKGNGFLTAPQFLKVMYYNNSIEIQAWIKIAWLPYVYSGEMELKGFMGWAIKQMLQVRVDNLIKMFNGASAINFDKMQNSL